MNAKFHALANRLSQLPVAIGDKQGRNGLADYLAFIPAGRVFSAVECAAGLILTNACGRHATIYTTG